MKKTKSQAVACSLDPANKNGLHHHRNDFADANDVVFEPSSMVLDEDLKHQPPPGHADDDAATGRGVAANLSRKKATPPQPPKKLVIKLNKGLEGFWILLLLCLDFWVNTGD